MLAKFRQPSEKLHLWMGSFAGWYQQACSALGALIAMPIYMNALGAELVGIWISAQAVVAVAGLADFGFSQVLSRQVAFSMGRSDGESVDGFEDIDPTQIGWKGVQTWLEEILWLNRLCLAVSMILIAVSAAVTVQRFTLEGLTSIRLWLVVVLLGATAVIRLIGRPYAAVLDGTGSLRFTRILGGTQQLAMAGGAAVLAYATADLVWMAAWSVVTAAFEYFGLRGLIARHTDIKRLHPHSSGVASILRILKVSAPMGVVNLGGFLYSSLQTPLIGALIGPSAVAPYFVAQRLAQFLTTGILQLVFPKLPRFSYLLGAGKASEARALFRTSLLWVLALSFIGGVFFFFTLESLSRQFFKVEPIPAVVTFVMALDLFGLSCAVLLGHFVLASGRNPLWRATLCGGLLNIIFLCVLLPTLGLVALPIASLAAGLLTFYGASVVYGINLFRELDQRVTTAP